MTIDSPMEKVTAASKAKRGWKITENLEEVVHTLALEFCESDLKKGSESVFIEIRCSMNEYIRRKTTLEETNRTLFGNGS